MDLVMRDVRRLEAEIRGGIVDDAAVQLQLQRGGTACAYET